MNELYHEYGQKKMMLDKKSVEYKNHWKAKKCWICKEKITCDASKLIFAHLKFLNNFVPQRLKNLQKPAIQQSLMLRLRTMMTAVNH